MILGGGFGIGSTFGFGYQSDKPLSGISDTRINVT